MKNKILILLISLFTSQSIFSQEEFSVEIEEFSITDIPEVQSYAWAKTSDGKWLIFGGRIEGLHRRQPFAAFDETGNNKNVFVIDPINDQVWTKSLSSLPSAIFEQLQSTNQNFYQRNNTLYIIGGYGYSAFLNDHITYPNLTAIDVDALASAIINNSSITSYFRQIADNNLAITGGQLGYLNNTFYLCGGQLFEGRYNPMGPNNGPGFIQHYSNEIRKFEIVDNGTTMSINNYSAIVDTANFHRRDYNMSPQIFPNGDHGFTMFSGPFNNLQLPFLNTIDITETSYSASNPFQQYLSNYHSAKIPVYDEENSTMHTIFFGGIAQYTMDDQGVLLEDTEVPFVKTISIVTRKSDGTMVETKLDIEMPAFLGSGAEFIPVSDDSLFIENEIVNLNYITDRTLVGYIYGGIESSAKNIFFTNTGAESTASTKTFKVYLNKENQNTSIVEASKQNTFEMELFPNPTAEFINLKANFSKNEKHTVVIYDLKGTELKRIELKKINGENEVKLNISDLAMGDYIILLKTDTRASKMKFYRF